MEACSLCRLAFALEHAFSQGSVSLVCVVNAACDSRDTQKPAVCAGWPLRLSTPFCKALSPLFVLSTQHVTAVTHGSLQFVPAGLCA